MDAHEKAAITEYVKHDAKAEGVAEKVYEAGKKAHVEEHVTKQEKGLINAIEKQLKGAATKAGKEVPKAEDLTKKAEKIFKDNKQFAKSGVVGKTIAGFRGLGTGGKIGTTLLGVAVAATAGMAISSMRKGSGSHVEQLQQSRAEAQVAPAPAR